MQRPGHTGRKALKKSIPSIMVDPITVLTAQETPDDWWVLDELSGAGLVARLLTMPTLHLES